MPVAIRILLVRRGRPPVRARRRAGRHPDSPCRGGACPARRCPLQTL